MRILVLSNIEWSDENAFGNTISNWFGGLQNIEFFSLYRRSSNPHNAICKKYYRITIQDTVRHWMQKEKIGYSFTVAQNEQAETQDSGQNHGEKKLINLVHKFGISVAHKIDNWIFEQKKWDNANLEKYIQEVNPDIIFTFILGDASALLLERVHELAPQSKIVAYIADDVFGNAENEKQKKRIQREIALCDKLYGASDLLCKEYEQIFKKPIEPLYKVCDFSALNAEPKKQNTIQMVYAGNLLYGRADTLAALVRAIEKRNSTGATPIHLDIYTATQVTPAYANQLNVEGASTLCAPKPYAQIKQIMQQSDVVLHVESFEEKQKKVVRYSFSTKIVDCLQSGSVLLAIGPQGIASIEYVRQIAGAFVEDDMARLEEILKEITEADLEERKKQIRDYAKKHHDRQALQDKLLLEFQK